MGSWLLGDDSGHVVGETVGSVAAHQPDPESNAPQDASKCCPVVQSLAVCLLTAPVRIANPAERDDAAGEPLVLRFASRLKTVT